MTISWLNVQLLTNKIDVVTSTIADHSLDVFAQGETCCDDARLRLATPAGYAVVDVARTTGRGGVVAIIYRQHLKGSRVLLQLCATFEAICIRLTTSSGPVVLLNIYRPGFVRPTASFFDELSSVLLEVLVAFSCPVLIGGDINIHVNDDGDADARHLHELLTTFDITQHIDTATHRCGHTLDVVMTFTNCKPDSVSVDPPGVLSDHSLVVCRLPVAVDPAPLTEGLVRAWRQVDRDDLRRAPEDSMLCQPIPDDANVDELFSTYDSVLRDIANRFASSHTIRRRADRRAPWFDTECRTARSECRRCERRYRRTRSIVDRRQ